MLLDAEALGEIEAGEVRQGQRRFDLVVRLADDYRADPMAVRELWVPTEAGERIPITELADIRQVQGPSTITREWQKRRVIVQAKVRDRDLGSFVSEARGRIAADVDLPAGYFTTLGGQFEHLQRASARLSIFVPIALAAILFLLYLSTRSLRDSLLVATGVPFRLRPILMTALVAALGFVPALNTSVGAEVQRPLATVVIGGVVADQRAHADGPARTLPVVRQGA